MYYNISLQAIADLDQIWDYIVQDNGDPVVATKVVSQIVNIFPKIGKFPYLGRSREDDLGSQRRSFAVNNYIVIYQIKATEIEIMRVLHSGLNVHAQFHNA
jgi:toxin ParE1/3/4